MSQDPSRRSPADPDADSFRRHAYNVAEWVDADPDFERVAPVPFSVVCFRAKPAVGARSEADLERLNRDLLDAVNASVEVFLSHTKLDERFVLRLAIGHIRTEERHVSRAWELLRSHATALVTR